jgi:DNA invertase Pin-like site-specific DNA recombinase
MKKTPQALAYSYIRFSNMSQAAGDSVRRQTGLRDAWLARNHATLDTALTLEDKGVSGFTGDHRTNPDRHALAAFLAMVKKGRIAQGSYLIVESLDRLSREDTVPAWALLLDLIQSGVRVVQLLPAETVFDGKTNPMALMMGLMELSRGHSESAIKSERVGAAWRDKKRRAAETGEVTTARGPAWLRLSKGRWELDGAAAETIKQIYQMAIDGHGVRAIVKKLNTDGIPPISHGRHWTRTYVMKLLTGRSTIGEYQPCKGRGRRREKDGEVIKDYYPAVVTEDQWNAARGAAAGRKGKAGRPCKNYVNIFTGLLRCAADGSGVQRLNKTKPAFVSYNAVQHIKGSRFVSFPAKTFEDAVLGRLSEIDPREILPQKDRGADKVLILSGRLAEAEAEVEKIKARLDGKFSDAVADVLERADNKRKELVKQLAAAQQDAASPLGQAWGECKTLVDVLKAAPDAEEARVRLRSALRRIVESIWCLFTSRGSIRLAAVQVWFTGGAHRDFFISHKAATRGSAGDRPSSWEAGQVRWENGVESLDLRRAGDVAALEKALEEIDLAARPPAALPVEVKTAGGATKRKRPKPR